jgi:hypothetical protein
MSDDAALQEVLDWYLRRDGGNPGAATTLVRRSSYGALLKESRSTGGRNPETGVRENPRQSASWLAALGYCCLIDQVGKAVRRKDYAGESYGFGACLEQFSDLDVPDREALFGLRNAFVHSYGLISRGKQGRPNFVFALDVDGVLVRQAVSRWDGSSRPTHENTTTVGLAALGDLVEAVHSKLLDHFVRGELTSQFASDDFSDRYLFEYLNLGDHTA